MLRRHDDAIGGTRFRQRLLELLRGLRQQVGLVHHRQHRLLADAEIVEHALDDLGALARAPGRDVHHLHQQVSRLELLERGAEGGHQVGR